MMHLISDNHAFAIEGLAAGAEVGTEVESVYRLGIHHHLYVYQALAMEHIGDGVL